MFGWADELALAADELELCIFSTQAGGSVIANGLRLSTTAIAIALGWWLGVMHSRREGGYTSGARCR